MPVRNNKSIHDYKRLSFSRGDLRVSSPVTIKGSTQLGPHLDNPHELLAGLIYLRQDDDYSVGGDLNIYRLRDTKKKIFISEKRRIAKKDLILYKTIPYKKNTAVFFIPLITAIHGISARDITNFDRRLINLSLELKEPSDLVLWNINSYIKKTNFLKKLILKIIREFKKIIGKKMSDKYGVYDWVNEEDL